jgi:hypothetical protein
MFGYGHESSPVLWTGSHAGDGHDGKFFLAPAIWLITEEPNRLPMFAVFGCALDTGGHQEGMPIYAEATAATGTARLIIVEDQLEEAQGGKIRRPHREQFDSASREILILAGRQPRIPETLLLSACHATASIVTL